MTRQLMLPAFDPPSRRPYAVRTRESIEAAEAVRPRVGRQQAEVLAFVASRASGATREEIAEGTGLRLASVCARAKELIDAG